MELDDLDLPILASLAGSGIGELTLRHLAEAGFEGVRPSHGYVIQQLVEGSPTIGELASALGMTQQGASKQVADLERLGYAERVAAEGDQRVRRVRLTARGAALMDESRRFRSQLEADVTRTLGAGEVTAAKRTLAELARIAGLDSRIRTRSVQPPSDQ